jgi:hypothetical protein
VPLVSNDEVRVCLERLDGVSATILGSFDPFRLLLPSALAMAFWTASRAKFLLTFLGIFIELIKFSLIFNKTSDSINMKQKLTENSDDRRFDVEEILQHKGNPKTKLL